MIIYEKRSRLECSSPIRAPKHGNAGIMGIPRAINDKEVIVLALPETDKLRSWMWLPLAPQHTAELVGLRIKYKRKRCDGITELIIYEKRSRLECSSPIRAPKHGNAGIMGIPRAINDKEVIVLALPETDKLRSWMWLPLAPQHTAETDQDDGDNHQPTWGLGCVHFSSPPIA